MPGSDLFRCKNIDQLLADAEAPERRLRKSLGWLSLTALGIGAIIGTGVFILTGTAAADEVVQYPSILKAPLLQVMLYGQEAAGVSGRPGAGPAIACLMFDQDRGGAIRTAGRADVYLGVGPEAEQEAGSLRREGQLYYYFLKEGTVPAP